MSLQKAQLLDCFWSLLKRFASQFPAPIAANFPPIISRHFQTFPGISSHFQAFSSIPRHFQTFQGLSSHFQTFPSISRHFQTIPDISRHCTPSELTYLHMVFWPSLKVFSSHNAIVGYLQTILSSSPNFLYSVYLPSPPHPAGFSYWNFTGFLTMFNFVTSSNKDDVKGSVYPFGS